MLPLSSTLHFEFEFESKSKAKTGSEQQTIAPANNIVRMKFSLLINYDLPIKQSKAWARNKKPLKTMG
tara:strand:- start:228 stop:431 length:204 start_codon:yes stop_codon:yes gene_type:complete